LERIDPEAAGMIASNDLRRIIRALEVSLKEKKEISKIRKISTHPLHYDFIKIGLFRDRAELYRIIEERVDRMMEKGLLEETRKLIKMNPGRAALQALGYKEMILFLEGHIDINEAVGLTKKRTKMYAKRQYTWFRKEPGIHWTDISGITGAEKIFGKVMNDIEILNKLIYSIEY
jgi:tRNA dimethylallyltransferase